MAAEKKAERAEKVKMSVDGQERFRNWAERLWPGRRGWAIVLLPAVPALAVALLTGDREIFRGQLAAAFYVLFLLAAICSRDFAAVYQKLALEKAAESRGARMLKRWLCGAIYYILWCGALFMIYLLG